MSIEWGKIIDLTSNQFVRLEFMTFMAPNYIFLIVGLIRYYSIKHMAETSIKRVQNSYYVKRNLSMLLAITYILNFILAEVKFSSLQRLPYWRVIAFLYLFGFFAWYFSFKLLEMELERELKQRWYTHRLFWILSFLLYFSRVLIDQRVNFSTSSNHLILQL